MASSLKALRDSIATIWESKTPPNQTNRPYRKVTARTLPDGASAHRKFWFDPPRAAEVVGFASNANTVRYEMQASLQLSTAGAGPDAQFDDVADEGALLMGAINFDTTQAPAGVQLWTCDGYSVVETEGDDLVLQFKFSVTCTETDGA